MEQLNAIGLDNKKTEELVEKLNELLANYSVFYQNTRGYHWNIKGDKFFELHVKFEDLYNNLQQKIDEIAERILALGFSPDHKYSDYLRISKIKESKRVSESFTTVKEILDYFKTLIACQRKLLVLSAEANDEGTNTMIADYTKELEKMVWMYSAYLAKGTDAREVTSKSGNGEVKKSVSR